LTGKAVPLDFPETRDLACVTVLYENTARRLLAFMRPGPRQDSHGNLFLAKLFRWLPLKGDTNIHGEHRPCINCGWCEEVCPAGIIPDLIWKCLGVDATEEAEAIRLMDCIECGLCSYVCPSKISLYEDLVRGKEAARKELHHD